MTFLTFLFVGVVWLADGSAEAPQARAEVSLAACQQDEIVFAAEVLTNNAANTPMLAESYHVECRAVTNDSTRRGA